MTDTEILMKFVGLVEENLINIENNLENYRQILHRSPNLQGFHTEFVQDFIKPILAVNILIGECVEGTVSSNITRILALLKSIEEFTQKFTIKLKDKDRKYLDTFNDYFKNELNAIYEEVNLIQENI